MSNLWKKHLLLLKKKKQKQKKHNILKGEQIVSR